MATPLTCPRCRVPLAVGHAAGTLLRGCPSCGGIWLDNASVERIVHALPADALGLADSATRWAKQQPDLRAAIACPECGRPLERRLVPQARVEIDGCDTHGTWFDRDELRQVAHAFAVARAYAPRAAGAASGAGVGAALAGGALLAEPTAAQRVQRGLDQHDDAIADGLQVAADVGSELDVAGGAEVAVNAGASALEMAGGAAEAAEGASELFGAIGDILGGL
jgi:Zn-finger nucleic acid-binding protein